MAAGKTGTLIRLMRQARGWSQHELAARSGYSQATISRVERGVSRAAQDTVILTDIAQALESRGRRLRHQPAQPVGQIQPSPGGPVYDAMIKPLVSRTALPW